MATKVCSNSQLLSAEPNKGCNHTLHLYAPNVDKYTIQKAFLIPARSEEKIVYVTANDRTILAQQFDLSSLQLKIIKPTEIRKLEKEENSELQLIMDAGSIVDQKDTDILERESYLNELSKRRPINCLCTYDMTRLGFEKIKQLSLYHNQLRLTTNDITILSGDFFDASNVSGRSIEKMVKDNLENIILAILQKKTMCGTEIIGTIHLKFNVLLSPGTIYPLLHSLKQKGLLTITKSGKEIIYGPLEEAKPKIRSLVSEHIQAHRLLNQYLQQEIKLEKA
jgi:DNA-binding PadR family transcriptional regulator